MSKRVRTTAAELRAPTGKLSADMRRAERIVNKSAQNMQRSMSRVESPLTRSSLGGAKARGDRKRILGGWMSSGKDMLKGAAVMGGVYGVQNEIKKAKEFEETLVDVAVRGGQTRKWLNNLRSTMISLSNEYGVGKEQLADYVGTIIDQTGNTQLATSTLKSMTAVAYSANVPMKELAGTVVELQSKLALAPKQFETALGVLAAQADKGKVPLNQMSQFLPEVLNATTTFGHTGIAALRDYGAVLQMAARGAGTLAEANTSMNRMLDQIAAKRGKIEKTLGIKLKRNGAWLQLGDMLKQIVAGLIKMKREGKDVESYIIKTFGVRGKKAILPMLQQGMAGWGQRVGAKGGKGGLTSFDALVAAGGAGTIQQRVSRKRQLSPELASWNKSIEQLKNKLHIHLLPVLQKLGKDVIPEVSKVLIWMMNNWKILLAIWAGKKMINFFTQLKTLAGGAGGGAGLFGRGAASAGTAAGGTAAAGAGKAALGSGFIGGISTATVAIGAFAASIAPAIAGLHEMGKAYTKEGKEKKLAQLRAKAKETFAYKDILQTGMSAATRTLGKEGLKDLGATAYKSTTSVRTMQEIGTRARAGIGRSDTENLVNKWMDFLEKKERAYFTTREAATIKSLSKMSPYEQQQLGVGDPEMLRGLRALLYQQETGGNLQGKGLEDFVRKFDKNEWADAVAKALNPFFEKFNQMYVYMIDPDKTAQGVTNNRRGSQ